MLTDIISVQPLENHQLQLKFEDNNQPIQIKDTVSPI